MNQVLITGANGYLGMRLARRYLDATDAQLLLWVHAGSREELQGKTQALDRHLGGAGGRVSYAWGDLTDAHPFRSIDPEGIDAIIHAAAVTRFNVDEETARTVNVEGTAKLLELAEGCRSLKALGLLSTVYSSGLKPGAIEEVPLDGAEGFANFYEWSKWESERLLLARSDRLPWRIFRIATIIADDDTGRVTQMNAFHNTLRLFYYGLLSVMPGKPETPLYFVTGDFVSDALFALMQRSADHQVYHVAHTQADTISLEALVELAFEAFNRQENFRSKRILKPVYCDAESFDLVVEGISRLGAEVIGQAVSSVAPFSRQLFISKEIRNDNLVSAYDRYRAPDGRLLIRKTCDYLVRTKWGREAAHAPA